MSEFENYQTVNRTEDADEKQWCVSVRLLKTVQQATVVLNNKKLYEYASRYPVTTGDVAVVGNSYAFAYSCINEPMATTGQMGVVTDTRPKLEIKKTTAAELDLVFTSEVTQKTVSDCVKYIGLPGDGTTLQYNKDVSTIYPITFLIRKILAAASVISNAAFADQNAIEKAKEYICSPQIIDEDMATLNQAAPEFTNIDLSDIHMDLDGRNLEELDEADIPYLDEGYLDGFDRDGKIDPVINEYVNKYTYMGAVSVMVRGGFVNLLEAFLSVDPPIKAFFDEMTDNLGETGNKKALDMIKEYKPVR